MLFRLSSTQGAGQATAALSCIDLEKELRGELSGLVTGAFDGLTLSTGSSLLGAPDLDTLGNLAAVAAGSRSTVVMDSYGRKIELASKAEGPARLARALAQLLAHGHSA